jgi:ABC-type Na+ efflux pump permease subunit
MRNSLFIARMDMRHMLRSREAIIWIFVMPIVFFFFIGTVTGGFGRRGGSQDHLALWIDGDAGFLGERLVQRLEERDYIVLRPATLEEFQGFARRLRVPAAFTDSVVAGKPVKLQFTRSQSGLGNDYDRVRIGRAVYTLLADVIVSRDSSRTLTSEALARLDALPRSLTLEVTPAGERREIPRGYEQTVPGILVMFVLLTMTTSGAILLFIERRQGLLRRLAYTPISRLAIVYGKWGGKLGVGLVQVAFGMLAGTVLFKMDWGPDWGMVILLMIVYTGMMATLGILLGSLARSEGQATAIGVVATNILAALGGCWWPIEVAPQWMQKLQLFLPTGWAMDALHKLVSFAAGPASVLPHIVGMLGVTLVLLTAASRVFRFE